MRAMHIQAYFVATVPLCIAVVVADAGGFNATPAKSPVSAFAAQRQDTGNQLATAASAASSAAASAASAASAAHVASTAAVAAITAASAADATSAALKASAAAAVANEAAHQADRASQQAAAQHQQGLAAGQKVQQAATLQQAVVQKQLPLQLVPLPTTSSWWSMLLQGITFGVVIKAMCMAGNVLVQVSPYPQAKRWEKRGSTGDVDGAPYVSIAFAGCQWCVYGTFAFLLTQRSGFLILVQSNFLGALLGTYYSITFYRNCRNEEALSSFHRYLSAVTTLVVFEVCTFGCLPLERCLFLVGLVSSFCSFVGAISLLVSVPVVLRSRDSRTISAPLVCANFGSALVWMACGMMLQDPLVYGPNVTAAMSSAACIYLKLKYPSSDDKPEDIQKLEEGFDRLDAKRAFEQKKRDMDEMTPLKPPPPVVALKPAPVDGDVSGPKAAVQSCGDCGETGGTF